MSFRKSPAKRLWAYPLSLFAALVSIASLVFPLAPSLDVAAAEADAKPLAPQDTVIATYDFETGNQGWGPFGSSTTTVVSDTARSGTHSLEVTGRTHDYDGAGLNVLSLLEVGATYTISGCTRLATGEVPTRTIITMKQIVGGSDSYPWIAATGEHEVTDSGWTCVQGSYTYADTATELTLYVQSPDLTAEFYLDDVTIVMTSPPPSDVIAEYNFDDGTPQGWGPFGSSTTTVVSDTARSSPNSLKVTGRTHDYDGAGLNVLSLLEVGATYTISGCTRLATGEVPTRTIITMKQIVGGSDSYPWIAATGEHEVTDSGWTCVQGSYTYADTATELTLYVQSPDLTAEFYLDDVTIVMTSPPPSDVIAEYNFDDDTTQGWVAHTDTVTTAVQVTSDTFRSSPNSLLTTGRSKTWHGAEVDVTSLLAPGVTYEISGCVRLVTGEPDSRVIISMERTVLTDTTYTNIVRSPLEGVTDQEWACLHGQYSAGVSDQLILYVESDGADVEFYLDDVIILSPPRPPIQTDIPSISETYSTTFLIGAALEPYQLDSIRHTQLLTYHFNSLTAENVMKPGPIHPSEGTYDWTGADRLADFARANGMVMHGHTLEWHQQNAEWMLQDEFGETLEPTPENKELVLNRLRTHVYSVTERYGDVVNVWDVVNEVIDESQPDCMRRSNWYTLTGSDYISVAFNAAYEKVPSATLILNDYGTTNTTKRECIYTVVQDLLNQGVPISGIGMQMHVNVDNPSPAAIEATIERFAELGVEVHITELDVSVYTDNTTSYDTVPEELLIQQGYRYYDIFEVFKRQADHIGSVTFWGMADDHTWLTNRPIPRVDAPMPFDQQQQAKYAYWGIIGNLSEIPPLIQTLDVPQGTPTVDGSSELLWDMLPWIEVEATETLTANFQTRWDADYLYVIVDVEDTTANVTDTVDIFIDEKNDKAGAYGSDDWHYTFQNGTISPSLGVSFSVVTDTNGYQLEAAFPLSATASIGDQIGFDVRVTDGSQPAFPISWNDPTHSQDTDTANWGTLTFIDAVKTTEAIHGLPVIDAVEDDAWAGANTITTDVLVEGVKEATATVKTMWGAGRLYVYAVVSDTLLSAPDESNAWEQDSIEVFVDQNNAKTSSYESDDGQYRVNYLNEQSVGGSASTDNLTSATRVISGGYVVELAIRLDAVAPSDGVLIGFDFQVNNDADGDGSRDGVVTWNDPTGQSYQNTSRLGVLMFTGIEYTNYFPIIARNAVTGADESGLDRHYPR